MTRIHISLITADLPASIAFYTALFGEDADKLRPDYARFQPAAAPLTLTLRPGADPTGPDHLGLKLDATTDARAAWRRLADAGLTPRAEEGVACCWSTQDKAWVVDPDGRPWEVYAMVDDADPVPGREDTTCCA